ncbi:MAG TPA: hypothetical protein VMI56_26520 [Reyranella sp.]|nr:hypothetical protein [Reyranella sp.]
MTKRGLYAASAAAVFALSALAPAASAEGTSVKCAGINSCKGTSACKTALSSCKGQNSCKGMGWTQTETANDCTSKGGKVQ